MPRTGLTQEQILDVAMELVIQKGFRNFSLRDLAKELHIKPPSVYNHFSGIDEINRLIAVRAQREMNQYLFQKIQGLKREEALIALGKAQLAFALENTELYRIILALPHIENPLTDQAASETSMPILSVLEGYQLSEADKIHLHRMFRSFVHGFIGLSQAGYLSHRKITTEESFLASLEYLVATVSEQERRFKNDFPEE